MAKKPENMSDTEFGQHLVNLLNKEMKKHITFVIQDSFDMGDFETAMFDVVEAEVKRFTNTKKFQDEIKAKVNKTVNDEKFFKELVLEAVRNS